MRRMPEPASTTSLKRSGGLRAQVGVRACAAWRGADRTRAGRRQ
jgi:hypothetical protein